MQIKENTSIHPGKISLGVGRYGFTDKGGLGIQSGFLRRYSPGSFSSPTTERAT